MSVSRVTIVISVIILCITLLVQCINYGNDNKKFDRKISGKDFSGSAVCADCHKDIYQNHIKTAHYLTSAIASAENIHGSFKNGENSFHFNNRILLKVEDRDSGFYQVEYRNGNEKKARRFDITVGSAARGQTFLYWWGDTLFQLPLTYFTAKNQWSNSPGYPGRVVFGRPVTSRCLECHTTFAQIKSMPDAEVEEFDRAGMVYGVDCEKCHGPGAVHVREQRLDSGRLKTKSIINPASFSRKQSLDLCILCHGGRLAKTRPSFTFQSGDKLSEYFDIDTVSKNTADIDVHGNQYGLLALSKCFTMSNMTCMTCHNVHENERGKQEVFSQRCLNCHSNNHEVSCRLNASLGPMINKYCIDCHMPEQPSKAIMVLLQDENQPQSATMHTHLIKAYPEETSKVISLMQKFRNSGLDTPE